MLIKAFGVESDQEIVQIVGNDPKIEDSMSPSLEEASQLSIFTQVKTPPI